MSSRVVRILSAPPDPKAPREIPTLDGARGLAAMLVLISHSASHGLLPQFMGRGLGQMGVILFFTLSGFLMAYLYIDLPFTRREVVRYAAARIGRVLPLYFAVLFVLWLAWLIFRMRIPELAPGNRLKYDWLLVRGSGVLWTIPVEVHFYVVFAGLWAVWQKAVSRVIAFFVSLGLLTILAIITGVMLRRSDPQFYHALSFWITPFFVGMFAGILYRRYWARFAAVLDRHWRIWWHLPILCLFVLAMPGVRMELGLGRWPIWGDPLALGAPILVFGAALGGKGAFSWLASPPARWLGTISYAVYLFHAPVISWMTSWLKPDDALERAFTLAAIVAITVLAASLSLIAFETPARRYVRGLGERFVGRVPVIA